MNKTSDPVAIIDEDGLPFAPAFQDHYFSRHDGRAETDHVFLAGNGLPQRWQDQAQFVIGELGFGTGLNFLETWHQWRQTRSKGQMLTFVSVEGFPLTRDVAAQALSAWPELADLTDSLLGKWDDILAPTQLDEQTTLHVLQGDVVEMMPKFPLVDTWFLDGFAPAKNPAMWSADVMCALAERTAPHGTFSSYTAAGWVRRNLADAGFAVEKRPGFGRKRDMIAGHKL